MAAHTLKRSNEKLEEQLSEESQEESQEESEEESECDSEESEESEFYGDNLEGDCVLNQHFHDFKQNHLHISHEVPTSKKDISYLNDIRAKDIEFDTIDGLPKIVGKGNFGVVGRYFGQQVAIKVLKEKLYKNELAALWRLRNPYIVMLYGAGIIGKDDLDHKFLKLGNEFIVFEYVPFTLQKRIQERREPGEFLRLTSQLWYIASGIATAMAYMHRCNIIHKDLRTVNILISNENPKVADFGLASYCNEEEDPDRRRVHSRIRTKAGDIGTREHDVLCFGIILCEMLEIKFPSNQVDTEDLSSNGNLVSNKVHCIPLEGNNNQLFKLAYRCRDIDPNKRPTFDEIVAEMKHNPYQIAEEHKKPLFECGKIKAPVYIPDRAERMSDTNSENCDTCLSLGYYERKNITRTLINGDNPNENEIEQFLKKLKNGEDKELYLKSRNIWKRKISEDEGFSNGKNLALKNLKILRGTDIEHQILKMEFAHVNFIHHKAMNSVWGSKPDNEKHFLHPNYSDVHPLFSTSMGAQIAVISTDGYFVFPRRSNRVSQSCGVSVCGAVEGMSAEDNCDIYATAVRGLKEELALNVSKENIKLMCPIYKFDTHEWGMIGFVDLRNNTTPNEAKLTYNEIQQASLLALNKDKYENQSMQGIQFNVKDMVNFVFRNQSNLASSSIVCALQTLISFYGNELVVKVCTTV